MLQISVGDWWQVETLLNFKTAVWDFKKSRIREKPNLMTCVDSRNNTKKNQRKIVIKMLKH